MKTIDQLLQNGVGMVYTAAAVQIRRHNAILYEHQVGTLDADGRRDQGTPTVSDTLFDLASLTKLFTTTLFFRLTSRHPVTLDTPLTTILPEFSGERPIRPYPHPLNTGEQVAVVPPTDALINADIVTFRHLLTHSGGLPAWLNLREASDKASRLAMCLTTPFAYPPGTCVVYSDIGYILLGLALARLENQPLDQVMRTHVIDPLGLSLRYGKIAENVAPTEFYDWLNRRMIGEVHDENAASLDGVAGHAGLFGTATDVAALGQLYLNGGALGTYTLDPALVKASTHTQIADRGLGWMMRSPEGSSSGHLFSPTSYGHTGFVGTSLWVDPQRELVCTLLTNNVFYGRSKDAILKFRPLFHDTVIEALDG